MHRSYVIGCGSAEEGCGSEFAERSRTSPERRDRSSSFPLDREGQGWGEKLVVGAHRITPSLALPRRRGRERRQRIPADRVQCGLDPIGMIRDPEKNRIIDLGVINERIGLSGQRSNEADQRAVAS